MSNSVGQGPTLLEAAAWLRDETKRHARIMDVAERNSVIEGLPRFTEAVRARIAEQLVKIASEQRSRLYESHPSAADNSA